MFQSGAQFMILVTLVGLVLMRESRQPPIDGLDEGFADFLAINSRRSGEPAPVTLVGIDESSLKERPWPWTPLEFAIFFQAAEVFTPAASATDEVLHWDPKQMTPDAARKLPQYQKILREHILRSSKVLVGARLGYPEDVTMERRKSSSACPSIAVNSGMPLRSPVTLRISGVSCTGGGIVASSG